MAKSKVSARRFLVAACILLGVVQTAYSQPAGQGASGMRSEWGWGGDIATPRAESAPEKKQVEIPYFDQDIGQHLLGRQFSYLVNADYIRKSLVRSLNVYSTPFGKLAYFGYTPEDFYDSVYTYLASFAWEDDLKKLSAGDAAFVRTIVYYCFTDILTPRYVQIQVGKIENESQRDFLEEFFRVKSQHDVLNANHWDMFIGLNANFFSHGANDKLAPGAAFDLGFSYCVFGSYCAEFRIGSIVGVEPYKEDIVQAGVTYPKEDISYTAVEALFRAKLIYSYDYDLSVFGGLRLHAIEFDTEEGKLYKEAGRKDMKNGYSYGFTTGIAGTKYFGGIGVIPNVFGLGARIGVANFGDNILDIGGYNWYGGIDLVMRFGMNWR